MKRGVAILNIMGTPAMEDPEGYGHMMGYGYGFGMMFGPVLWLIVLGLLVVGVIWLVRRWEMETPRKSSSNALIELDLRLARGEIEIAEYNERKKVLTT